MSGPDTILEFEGATVGLTGAAHGALCRVTARLPAGGCCLVLEEPAAPRPPVLDAAVGLAAATEGRIRFMGESWADLTPDAAAARRGRIGCVFAGANWISNLNVAENVTLAARHHTRRTVGELESDARRLAREAGLDGIPAERPHRVEPRVLRRCAWVRAFLGAPRLVVLERPLAAADPGAEEALCGLAAAACRGGAAVLWIAARGREPRDGRLPGPHRLVMSGCAWTEEKPR